MMEENKLTVSLDGQDITIKIIDVLKNQENEKQYIIYTPLNSEKIYASILEETATDFILKEIETEEEINKIENVLLSLQEGNGDK